jgi:hypothetical protein
MTIENDFTRVFGAIKELEERVERMEAGSLPQQQTTNMIHLAAKTQQDYPTVMRKLADSELRDENNQLRFILSILAAVKDDGWIEWHGGECPVGRDVRVDIKTRASGHIYSGDLGGEYYWHQSGRPNDIIAYRIAR